MKTKINYKEFHSETEENVIKTGVYLLYHINKPGIYYVGSATIRTNTKCKNQGFNLRWRLHIWSLNKKIHGNPYLQNVSNKYGLYGFRFKILEINESDNKTILDREQYWINFYDCVKSGYNITPLAGNRKGSKLSGESKNNKKVKQYNLQGKLIKVYNSARIASKETGISYKYISSQCLGKTKHSQGFTWRFENDSFNKFSILKQKEKFIKIDQFSLSGIFIKTWSSEKEIVDTLKISWGNLSSCITGKRKSAGSYIWKKRK